MINTSETMAIADAYSQMLSEAKFDKATVEKATKVALEMGGDMTGAVNKIEKMAKGLSKHKEVQAALRLANEEKVNEVEEPKAKGEKEFKDKHVVKKTVEEASEELEEAKVSVPTIKMMYGKMLVKAAKTKEGQQLGDMLERFAEIKGQVIHSGNSAGLAKAMFDDLLEALDVRQMNESLEESAEDLEEKAKEVACEECGKVHEGACESTEEAKKLDPVGKEDDDVDNDGDVDDSDKYLKNRRKAVSKAAKKD